MTPEEYMIWNGALALTSIFGVGVVVAVVLWVVGPTVIARGIILAKKEQDTQELADHLKAGVYKGNPC